MLNELENILRRAGQILLSAHDVEVSEKSGRADLVTQFDRQIQAFLEKELMALCPEAGFLGEEEAARHLEREKLFIVDPIDGTTNFTRDFRHSCISAALDLKGETVLGAVYNPYLDEMFSAEKGRGAFLNGQPIRASERDISHAITLFGSSPYNHELAEKSFAAAQSLFLRGLDVRRAASAALDLCYIAAGRADVYFEYTISPWDHAAGHLIAQEAGAIVTQFDGSAPSNREKCSVLACGKNCYADALEVIRSI
ncbi:MAG: inositol monophosphatase family protein [Candidatus Heteroscillospira sp.]|jgi:myo-inositol-1(or 4)-monophosphatase